MTTAIVAPAGIASVQNWRITLHATISKGTKAASKMKKLYPAAKPKASSTHRPAKSDEWRRYRQIANHFRHAWSHISTWRFWQVAYGQDRMDGALGTKALARSQPWTKRSGTLWGVKCLIWWVLLFVTIMMTETPISWLDFVVSSMAGGSPNREGEEERSRTTVEKTTTDVNIQSSTNSTTDTDELNVSWSQLPVCEVMASLKAGVVIADTLFIDKPIVVLNGRDHRGFAASWASPVLDVIVWLFLLDTTGKKCFIPKVRGLLEIRHGEDLLRKKQGSYERGRTGSAAGGFSNLWNALLGPRGLVSARFDWLDWFAIHAWPGPYNRRLAWAGICKTCSKSEVRRELSGSQVLHGRLSEVLQQVR